MKIVWLIVVAVLAVGSAHADTLVVCTEGSPNALNPQLSTANTSFDVGEQTSDRLVEMKIGGSDLVPGLGTSWDVSADGLRYVFHLRRGVHWQSSASFKPSRDFNADDVVFSFHRMMDPADPFYVSAGGSFPEFQILLAPSVKAVERVDDETVAFTLKAPLAPLLPTLTMQPMQIVSAEYAAMAMKEGHPDLDRSRTDRHGAVQLRALCEGQPGAFPRLCGFLGKAGTARARGGGR